MMSSGRIFGINKTIAESKKWKWSCVNWYRKVLAGMLYYNIIEKTCLYVFSGAAAREGVNDGKRY